MLCIVFLVLTSVLYTANSQQGQNFYFPAGENRQQARFIPFQQNQFQAPQQSFVSYFPQTNGGPYSPFRSGNFHVADSNALSSSQKFQSQQQFSVPPFQLNSQNSDTSDPRFDPLISAPGVFTGGSNENFGETGYAEPPQEVPSQRFNSQDRQPNQFRSSQLTRYSPVAISEVTRTQDNPNSPNILQTHSFNVHHTTRHPEELPLTQNNRWRSQNIPDIDNFNFRARNVPVQHFSSVKPTTIDTITEDVFSRFNNRFAPKQQSFSGDTQHVDVLESPETQSEEDSTALQYHAHDSYVPQSEKKKETVKLKNINNANRNKTNVSILPTTYSSLLFLENRIRNILPTSESAASETIVTTHRPQSGSRNNGQNYRGRNRYSRPSTEIEKNVKNTNIKAVGTGAKNLSTAASEENVNFDIVTMSQDHLFVSEDNFKGFVDSASIDSTESIATDDLKDALEGATVATIPVSHAPVKKKMLSPAGPKVEEERADKKVDELTTERNRKSSITRTTKTPSTSTEGYIIVASVQTSRSVSGARFIPSAAIKQEQHPLPLDAKSIKDIKSQINNKTNDTAFSESSSLPKTASPKLNTTAKTTSTLSTESIIDKLDQVQSDLSSGILSAFPSQEKQSNNMLSGTSSKKNIETSSTTEYDEVEETSRRKFVPTFKTTSKPKIDRNKSLFDSIQFDDLTDLLPPGFKGRGSFSPKSSHSTTKTTKPLNTSTSTSATSSSSTTSTTEKTNRKDKTKSNSFANFKHKIKFDDVSAFLPPGYKPPPEESTSSEKSDVTTENLNSTTVIKVPDILSKAKPVDLGAFLPPGFKPNMSTDKSTKSPSILEKIKFKEVSDLLPPDYTTESTKSSTVEEKSTTKTENIGGSKVVFPSRPGGGTKKLQTNTHKNGTAAKSSGLLPYQIPVIVKGWPVRSTTEFAGWPMPSPSPISIEKILQAAKEAQEKDVNSEAVTSTSTTTIAPTTTTTTRRTTTPGICSHDCDLFGSVKLVGGAKWVPELLDHNTKEYRTLAFDVQHQLEMIFQSSEALSRWYKKITIDAFNPGSVIVDYFVEQSDLGRTVNTADMKRLFHDTLLQETVTSETFISANNSDYRFLKLGKFLIDPTYTDFIVIQRSVMPAVRMAEDMWLPQWAIAVIVIGLASLLFVLIFGITVVISRHKNSKKHPTALTEEMLNELNKSHMGGFENYGAEDLYNMEDVWNEKPFKKRSSYFHDGSMPNIYDSWRSDWNGYYGGSYYNGSVRSGYSRRRSDYDTNF